MKDTAPISTGIIAISALFGIVAAGVALVMWGFGVIGAFFIGVIVAVIVAILLMLGWRKPAAKPGEGQPSVTHAPAPAPTATPAKAAEMPAAAPAAVAKEPAPAPAPAPSAEPAPAAAPAAKPKAKAAPKAKPAPKEKAAPKAKAAAKPKAKPVAADGKPEMLSAPRGGAGDDLKQIKGVGPKMEGMLNSMGVWHFDQVASWRKKEVEWVDNNLEGFKGRVSRDEWVKQAKVLAKGGTTEFSKKVKKGGVY